MADNSKVHFLTDPAPFREKERLYLEVRRREGRVFPDEMVRQLPFISKSNLYAREWIWRRRTSERFLFFCKNLSALRGKNAERTGAYQLPIAERTGTYNMTILDLGCGNGWLANRLAENPDWEVWAVDVNEEELTQGARLFGRENLRFVFADVFTPPPMSPPINRSVESENPAGFFPQPTDLSVGTSVGTSGATSGGQYDIIVLAASVQYFPDVEQLIFSLKKCLKRGGQIHILDSPFYENETARAAAQQRTLEYYTKIGVPEMAVFYHHHLWADIEKSGGKNLNDRLTIRFLQKVKWFAPFPWVVIG